MSKKKILLNWKALSPGKQSVRRREMEKEIVKIVTVLINKIGTIYHLKTNTWNNLIKHCNNTKNNNNC